VIGPELRAELEAALPGAIRFDVTASKLTSLRIGGLVDALATPPTAVAWPGCSRSARGATCAGV